MYTSDIAKINNESKKTIFLTAGGTGGHMFPAEALAWEFYENGWCVIFITDHRGKNFMKTFPPDLIFFIQKTVPLKFKNPFKLFLSLYSLALSILNSTYLLIKYNPSVVVGFGGYPTFPTIFSAYLLRFKTIIHEGNVILGKVNKFFSRRVDLIACSFWPTIVPKGAKIFLTGNPIRKAILTKNTKSFQLPSVGTLKIVVVGGSQGASFFSEIIPLSINKLSNSLKKRLHVIHQARSSDCFKLTKQYDEIGIKSTVEYFFNNIEDIFSEANLIITRSGASTISEVLFFGRPLILIPIKNSIYNHQKLNALALVKKNAALCIDQDHCTSCNLAEKISQILSNDELAIKLAKNSKKMFIPNASLNLKLAILKILNGEKVGFEN